MQRRVLVILGLLLVGAGVTCGYFNNQESARLAVLVTQADAAAQPTAAPLATLKSYVASHVGAGASFTLTATYQRDQDAAKAQAAAEAANSQIYADAQRVCGGKSDSITQAKCNQDYLAKHLQPLPNPQPVAAPVLANYQYRLSAPLWTPDLAGALLLGGLLLLAWAAVSAWRRRRGRR